MRAKPMMLIVLALILAMPAFGQGPPPWEVRAYLSTYTDGAGSGTQSWTWNMTAVRHRYVCPYCGYSTDNISAAGDTCPNPFGIASHPADVELVPASPKDRILGYLGVTAEDVNGNAANPLIGRPFHPGGADWEDLDWNTAPPGGDIPWEVPTLDNVASFVTARMDSESVNGLFDTGYGLRFLVIEPGSVRAEASYRYVSDAEAATVTPTFYRTVGGGTAAAADYKVYINPYRVSDGDVWYIRHLQTAAGTAEVEVYSKLYGLDFDSAGAIDAGQYATDGGCRIITDSGALMVDVPAIVGAAGDAGRIIKIVIDSNTQTLPSPLEMDYDFWDGEGIYTDPDQVEPVIPAGSMGPELSDTYGAKGCYVLADLTVDPILSTANPANTADWLVVEKEGETFNTAQIWPYRVPPEAAGAGRIMLQWSPLTAAGQPVGVAGGGTTVYYREGNEWHYMADLNAPATQHVTNGDVAAQTAMGANAAFIDTRFMASRPDVDLDPLADFDLADAHDDVVVNDRWVDPAGNVHASFVQDDEPATGGLPRLILGELFPGTTDDWRGEYNPGTRTPTRLFSVANRTQVTTLICPVDEGGCGARFEKGMEYLPGDPLEAGDLCPACRQYTGGGPVGVRLEEAPGEADLHYDAHDAPETQVGTSRHWLTPDAVKFGPSGSRVPMGALDFRQEVHVEIPPYQPPSVPSRDTFFDNDLPNDQPYEGLMLAFHQTGDEADETDGNFAWDWYYQAPQTGAEFGDPTAAPDDSHADWTCPVCGTRVSGAMIADLDGDGDDDCPFCLADPQKPAAAPFIGYDTLVAEEYDPFGLRVSVLRKAALAADERVVDLGWVAPGVPQDAPNTVNEPAERQPGDEGYPTDVSLRSDVPVRNEGNIDSVARMRSGFLFRTEIDSEVRSYPRWAQSVPVTVGTLFRYRPGIPEDVEFGAAAWSLWRQQATGAAGERATSRLQAGVRSTAGAYAGTIKPVPMGQPAGNYANEVLLYIDLDQDGALDFYDALAGVTDTTTQEFDPDVDEPFEPVASFATRMRVVEARLPHSGFYSKDVEPTALYDASRDNLQVLWAGQRISASGVGSAAAAGISDADRPSPSHPFNILYANAELSLFGPDPVYRGWLWSPAGGLAEEASALTASVGAESNASPTAYMDEANDQRWAMWHRSLATDEGMSSQLRFDSSADMDWDGSTATEFLFGTGGAHRGLTGFVREGAANRHWLFWHAGPQGREHLRYRWEFDPTSGTIPGDALLHVSNSVAGGPYDFFAVDVAGQTYHYRKPAETPFTYVKQPSAFGGEVGDPANPEFQVDVFFTGHIRALGNSDICWSRFNFGPIGGADFPYNGVDNNYGKVPFPRMVNADGMRMPEIYDAEGDLRGYAGEQLQPSPRRQSFQSRDIDWLVTKEVPDPAARDEPFNFETKPDWTAWLAEDFGMEQYDDPKFYVGVVTEAGGTRTEDLYAVSWANGSYDRSTGIYTVTPVLTGISAAGTFELPLNPGHPDNNHLGELIDPAVRREAEDQGAFAAPGDYASFMWPSVRLRISPASGTLKWSSPLFNPDHRGDRLAVFNSENTPGIVDVVMYADYTPFVRRVTTDEANDDSPSAFYDLAGSSRLTVFWRRSYGGRDTPHFGRPSFMHRSFTRALQVARPPITAGDISEVWDVTAGEEPPWVLASEENGIITIEPEPATTPARVGHRIRVSYNGEVEQHRVIGWSVETPVPVNTVIAEGPVRAFPEIYTVPGTNFQSVRYWLLWSSARSVFDLRPPDQDGQQVQQATDVYLAVVAPEYGSLIADLQVPRVGP
ncbi:MAG: hypothetical protein ACP5KN_09125 [Armatimonadota bacterium]